jgi:hypothetical protein
LTGASPSGSFDATYGSQAGDVIECTYGTGQLSIEAGMAGFSGGFNVAVFFTDIATAGPFSRTDTWQSNSTFLAQFKPNEAHDYWFFYDCQSTKSSTCTTTVTEFSSTRLEGTIDCSDLVPQSDSVDAVSGCSTVSPHASASITFDCSL